MLMILNYMLPMILFMSGVLVFSMKYKHLLCTLLSLEYIVLSLFYLMSIYLMNFSYEFWFLMIFLTFSVCEGALGLSILVSMIRTHGNDYFQSFNLMC
uniref:NADH-ubiquinone oxidoreductase chain 4L n=1 Tax=Isoscelipteron pectinatum TaxID=2856572 RepID=A0A8F8KLB1_9NEOP|nr:NADH dehydrogenase subunit 4l [Isoscelipteron pectinatum]